MPDAATPDEVIRDWYDGLCNRDPYDDLGTLVAEIERLRRANDRMRRRVETAEMFPVDTSWASDGIVTVAEPPKKWWQPR